MFTNILVTVDGSDNSYRALDAALFFLEKLSSNITVIHVMEQVPITHIGSEKLLSEMLEAYTKENQDILSKCSEIATQKGLTIKTLFFRVILLSNFVDYSKKKRNLTF